MKKLLKQGLNTLMLWLQNKLYEPLTLDKLNNKPAEAVPGLMIEGRQLYRFKNELDMPIKRKVALSAFDQWFDLGVTTETLAKLCKAGMDANNEGDSSRVGSIFYSIQDVITNCTPREAVYQIGAVLFWFDDEDLKTYDGDLAQYKIERFKEMDEGFFLRLVLECRGISSESSQRSILTSLRQTDMKLNLFRSLSSGV